MEDSRGVSALVLKVLFRVYTCCINAGAPTVLRLGMAPGSEIVAEL